MRTLGFASRVALGLACSAAPSAAQMLDVSGQVSLLDGTAPDDVTVTLAVDLDRDGELNSFEQLHAQVQSDGSYSLEYTPDPTDVDLEFVLFVTQLLADYEASGFEALLEDGPLPIVVRFEREGYSTVIKRFSTLHEAPRFDISMEPLNPVHCRERDCLSPDGAVRISGFPGGTGIDRAFARAHDPENDASLFPGVFADSAANLLISSGFTEIDLRDEAGERVHRLSSPVSVRFEADRNSWPALRDLQQDSGSIEVPMYSFNEATAEWVAEADGELEDEEGVAIQEQDFESILDGSREEPVFIAFETDHFSTFNCDAPVNERACVKGRITVEGEGLAGVQVSVQGISYTGSAGGVITGADGSFASDVMKSELSGEDVDGDRTRGETFEARVTASAAAGVFVGAAFDTPSQQASISRGSVSCLPEDCECLDLGDIETSFEAPRACEVSVRVTFSGQHLAGAGGAVAAGDPLAEAQVMGTLAGSVQAYDPTLCEEKPCGAATTDADGQATFVVPVLGDAPRINLSVNHFGEGDEAGHYYSGELSIEGCARGEASIDGTIELEVKHAQLGDLGSFIAALGGGPAPASSTTRTSSTSSGFGIEDPTPDLDSGCGCRAAGSVRGFGSAWSLGLIGAVYFALGRSRRKRRARSH